VKRSSTAGRNALSVLAAAPVVAAAVLIGSPAQAISGGTPTTTGFGYVAKIAIGDSQACTATLVDPFWLLTARSCFSIGGQPVTPGAPPQPTTATVGRHDLNGDGGLVTTVVEVQPHPGRELALARLAAPVPGVEPVKLAPAAPAAGATVRVAGFGRTATEWAPDVLQSAQFAVRTVNANTLDLTGQTAAGRASLCQGDAGAPIVTGVDGAARVVAISTASWQSGCLDSTETRDGAVGARVDGLGDWVERTTYRPVSLRNVKTTKCADIPWYESGSPGTQVFQYTCDNTSNDNQLMFFDPRGRKADGQMLYSVRNAKDNLCLDAGGYDAPTAGAPVIQFYCAGPEDNQFVRVVQRNGGVWLVNDKSGLCLDVVDTADNPLSYAVCSDTDDHLWMLDRAEWTNAPPRQAFAIGNFVTGQCVDVPQFGPGSLGQQLYQYTCNTTSADNQLWWFDVRGRTADGQVRYEIRNAKDNLCLGPMTANNTVATPGVGVSERECGASGGHTVFTMVPHGAGIWMVNEASGLCLDVVGVPPGRDVPLSLFNCNPADDHVWNILFR